jgi:hypothetical protein
MEDPELVVLEAEFPGWEFWRTGSQVHARKPEEYGPGHRPVMVWGDSPDHLRAEIRNQETGK